MNGPEAPDYRTGARLGLANETLQKNLKNLQNRFGRGALKEWAVLEDPDLRDRVKKRRMEMLEHLDVVLALLADKVEQNGGTVFLQKRLRKR
jgi:L-lactate utilization protein LutB